MRVGFEKGKDYFVRAGFIPAEANELAHTSKQGTLANYFQKMVRSRRSLFVNARRYNWSDYHYRQRIREDYEDKGILGKNERWNRNMVWQLLRFYQERFPVPDDYSSPWQKRMATKRGLKRRKKKVTRLDMIIQRIGEIDRKLVRAKSEARKMKLREQREDLMRQAGRLR